MASELRRADGEGWRVRKKIGECLIQAGLITEEDLQIALAEHKRTGERVGAVLVRLNFATEKQITKAGSVSKRIGLSVTNHENHLRHRGKRTGTGCHQNPGRD